MQRKVIWLIGAGTGIGETSAKLLASEGYQLILSGRRPEKLHSLASTLEAKTLVVPCDVANLTQINDAVEVIRQQFSNLDAVVNFAGVHASRRSFDELTLDDWDLILSVNTRAVFQLLKAVLPLLRESRGHFVSISSVAATKPSVLAGAAYTASKHALNGLIRTVAEEEKKHGVRFSTISPGPTNTPLVETRKEPPSLEERQKLLQPEAVAKAVFFTLSLPENAFVEELILRPLI